MFLQTVRRGAHFVLCAPICRSQVDETRANDDAFIDGIMDILAKNDIAAVQHFRGLTKKSFVFEPDVSGGKKVSVM